MKTRFVLSIDGGGVRGIVAAVILDALEGELRALGVKKPLGDCFDVIAGTSTGSIIAAGLAAPNKDGSGPLRSPSQLRDLYRRESKRIFPQRRLLGIPVISSLRQLFGPLYSPNPLKKILEGILGECDFRSLRRNLIVTGYSIDPRNAVFFRGGPNTPTTDKKCAGAIRIKDAVLGSTAAPTFFPPHQVINRETGDHHTVIDGGVFINDPAIAGLAEAARLFPNDDVMLISIGTGRVIQAFPFDQARNWGFLEWVSPIGQFRTPLLSAISDGQARAVNEHLLKFLGKRYKRFDYDLSRNYGSPALDDSSSNNIKMLERGALKMAEEMRDDLHATAKLLATGHKLALDDA